MAAAIAALALAQARLASAQAALQIQLNQRSYDQRQEMQRRLQDQKTGARAFFMADEDNDGLSNL